LAAWWLSVAGERLKFRPGKRQRYYFISENLDTGSGQYASFWIGSRNQISAQQQYLGRRGAG
jgi:hypothetical protein